jgi:hypothetical protein
MELLFSRTKECFHHSLICQLITAYVILSIMWQYNTHDKLNLPPSILNGMIKRHKIEFEKYIIHINKRPKQFQFVVELVVIFNFVCKYIHKRLCELELLGPLIYVYYIFLEFNFVSFYHSILFLPQIHMVLHGTTFFADKGMFPLFTHLSADYCLYHLVS